MLQTSSDAHDHVMRFTTLNMDSLMLHDQHAALNGSTLSLKLRLHVAFKPVPKPVSVEPAWKPQV